MSIFDDIAAAFEAPVDVIQDVVSFLQWISWIFNPINWVRAVEFVTGMVMLTMGLRRTLNQRPSHALANTVRSVARVIPGPIGETARLGPKRKHNQYQAPSTVPVGEPLPKGQRWDARSE